VAATPVVLSHWSKLVEGLQASPMEFYAAVEESVRRREMPESACSRVDYFEGGAMSAKREYLRVRRKRLVLDICGAPFGKGFFFSWWLGELRSGPGMLVGILFGLAILLFLAFQIGTSIGILFFLFGIPAILWFLVNHAPEEFAGWDDPILGIPFVGPVYQRLFRPQTYYKIDTASMFQSAVHAAVLEIVDDLSKGKGLRALSEADRQPTLREFFTH